MLAHPREISLFFLSLCLLPSCAAPLPMAKPKVDVKPAVVVLPTPTVPPATPVDPSVISTTALALPTAFVLDGDVGEWGSLLPLARRKAPGSFKPWVYEPEPEEGEAPKPPPPLDPIPPVMLNAVSRLAVALTNESVLVAAELSGGAEDGIWFGLGAIPSHMPAGGVVGPWGNNFESFSCPEFVMDNCDGYPCASTTRTPPDEMAACKVTLAKVEAAQKAHDGRFRKIFRIEKDGVKLVAPDGQLGPVTEAKVVWKKGSGKVSVEVSLPTRVMPRLAEAPLSTLVLAGRIASAKETSAAFDKTEWVASNLPAVVSYEPYGDLRAALFTDVNTIPADISGTGMTRLRQPMGPSYQPGEPLKVETMDAGDTMAEVKEGTLFVPQGKLGDVEVGRAHVGRDFVVILKSGKLSGIVGVEDSASRGILTRNKQLHVFNATSWPWSNNWNATLPFWSVIVVEADGKFHEAIVPQESEYDSGCHHLEERAEIGNKKLDRLGFSVKCLDVMGQGNTIEVVHQWDERKKAYVIGTWKAK